MCTFERLLTSVNFKCMFFIFVLRFNRFDIVFVKISKLLNFNNILSCSLNFSAIFARIVYALSLYYNARIFSLKSFNNRTNNARIIKFFIFVANSILIFFIIFKSLYSSCEFLILIRKM